MPGAGRTFATTCCNILPFWHKAGILGQFEFKHSAVYSTVWNCAWMKIFCSLLFLIWSSGWRPMCHCNLSLIGTSALVLIEERLWNAKHLTDFWIDFFISCGCFLNLHLLHKYLILRLFLNWSLQPSISGPNKLSFMCLQTHVLSYLWYARHSNNSVYFKKWLLPLVKKTTTLTWRHSPSVDVNGRV